MRELIAFAAGIVIGAGALAIANIRRQQAPAPKSMPEPSIASPEPFSGYDAMPIQTIRESLRALSLADRKAVRVYEQEHLKRKGILNVLTALEEERANGNA